MNLRDMKRMIWHEIWMDYAQGGIAEDSPLHNALWQKEGQPTRAAEARLKRAFDDVMRACFEKGRGSS